MARCNIIAEIGVNHDGNIDKALFMVDEAKQACADAVKFQSFNVDKLTRSAEERERLRPYQLTNADHRAIKDYCDRSGIEFLSTPFDLDSLAMLLELGVKRIKISSGDITYIPLLSAAAKTNLPILLSTGMANPMEIKRALKIIAHREVTVLHCTSSYPCDPKDVNLRAMPNASYRYGFSDHTKGSACALAAVALGATVIEKHFTLSTSASGPDHHMSTEPEQFKQMVQSIRIVEAALGDGIKRCMPSEEFLKARVRRSCGLRD